MPPLAFKGLWVLGYEYSNPIYRWRGVFDRGFCLGVSVDFPPNPARFPNLDNLLPSIGRCCFPTAPFFLPCMIALKSTPVS